MVFAMRMHVGVGVRHCSMLVAMGVNQIGAQQQVAIGEDIVN